MIESYPLHQATIDHHQYPLILQKKTSCRCLRLLLATTSTISWEGLGLTIPSNHNVAGNVYAVIMGAETSRGQKFCSMLFQTIVINTSAMH